MNQTQIAKAEWVTGYFLLHFLPKIKVFETSTKPEGFVMILALAVSAG